MKGFLLLILIVGAIYLFKRLFRSAKSVTKSPTQLIANTTDSDHLPEQFIVADIETTGFSATKDKIIEISAIKIHRNSNNHNTLTALINPGIRIPAKITKITGITDKMVRGEGKIEDELKEFLHFFGELPLVFYNASFDMKFLKEAAKMIGREINNEVIDALQIARMAFPNLTNHKLSTVANHLNISTEGAHRALNDCAITLQVFNRASGQIGGFNNLEQNKKHKKNAPSLSASCDIDQMISELNLKKDAIDRHFHLQDIVSEAYRKRKDPRLRRVCIEMSEKHLSELSDIIPPLKSDFGTLPLISTFQKYATVLAEDGKFEKAIEVCEIAISYGLHDGTKSGFEGRISRIKKKHDKAKKS
jgi:DNA polymerase III epsilon subunit family exonuclease